MTGHSHASWKNQIPPGNAVLPASSDSETKDRVKLAMAMTTVIAMLLIRAVRTSLSCRSAWSSPTAGAAPPSGAAGMGSGPCRW